MIYFKKKSGINVTVKNGPLESAEEVKLEADGSCNLSPGVYSFLAEGEGFCSVHKIFTVEAGTSDSDIIIDVPAIPIEGKTAEVKECLFLLSDQLEDVLYSMDNLKEVDWSIFNTPAFSEGKTEIEFTTQAERRIFLKKIISGCKHMDYREEEFSMVICTANNIAEEKTLDDILNKLKIDDKLNVVYMAQIHGNEVSSGEAALAVIRKLSGVWGEKLLEKMNIIVIPCANVQGADAGTREWEGIDLNRDSITETSDVTRKLHYIYHKLLPECIIDGHNFKFSKNISKESIREALFDIRLSYADNINVDRDIVSMEEEIIESVFDTCAYHNIRYGYYKNSENIHLSRNYYSLIPTCYFLIEGEGTRTAKKHLERNVWNHYISVTSMLEEIWRQARKIKSKVKEVRIKEVYRNNENIETTSNRLVVKHGSSRGLISYVDEYDFYGNLVEAKAAVISKCFDVEKESIEIPEKIFLEPSAQNRRIAEYLKKEKLIEYRYEGDGNISIDTNQLQRRLIVRLFTDGKDFFMMNEK